MNRRRITALKAVPLAAIRAHPDNVRDDLGDLTELARSLRAQGVLQPVLLAPDGEDSYVLLDGHRRRAAAELAGLPSLPALITDRAGGQDEVVATMLAASMHRQLTPMEQARAFRRLRKTGVSVEEIASTSGFSASTVRKRLDWMLLPEQAQQMIIDGEISRGQADELARQVRTGRSGSTRTTSLQPSHLVAAHPAADVAREMCTHTETHVLIGQVACSRCWEAAIRADERDTNPLDEVAVSQAVAGDIEVARSLNPREREEAVRILTERGLSAAQISTRLSMASRHVVRLRSPLKVAQGA